MENNLYNQQETGRKVPFTVPEDYFEKLESRVMANISALEDKRRKQRHRLHLVIRWAACLAVLFLSSAVYLCYDYKKNEINSTVSAQKQAHDTQSYNLSIDQVSDYAMLDNDDMYSYLANE